ncbi:hypothetical protein DPMN_174399 [Dreissena polymorpha]|uniref:2'-phosphotransferase n=1 Tax=Dreissena polymorpha TaxID=45954 RepID=A0A9D4E3B7_DREPO|nr:hypothetical protein DPMN_174399 [Dreissena polymorpha]
MERHLVRLLRHADSRDKVDMRQDGYTSLPSLQRHIGGLTEEKLRQIVRVDEKGRYSLKEIDGVLHCRATQGHSKHLGVDLNHKPATSLELAYHGTNRGAWESIKREGLQRGRRQHIHMAQRPTEEAGIPRSSAITVIIAVDVKKAIQRGVNITVSENDVVLSEGPICPCLFRSANDRSGSALDFGCRLHQ